jgi:hypothetical protein
MDGIKEFQTRFIYPFYFDMEVTADLEQWLLSSRFTAHSGKEFPVWVHGEPHDFYVDELLVHIRDFLFGNSRKGDGRYLKLSAEAADAWFNGLKIGSGQPVLLVSGPRIEVFLSSKGLGVLSVALTPGTEALNSEDACRFNYVIGQLNRRDVVRLRRRHPQDDESIWQKIPSEKKDRIAPAPEELAPLEERLGAPGGSFYLRELIEQRLLPVVAMGLHPAQEELAVFTVARLGSDIDFANESCRQRQAALLSSLAQLEEPEHAGATADILSIPSAVLNRKHWAATGQLGVAHLIADQSPPGGLEDHPFNEQRLPIVRDKYFIPYLMALFQKLALNRAMRNAHAVLALSRDLAEKRLDGLRGDLFEFGVSGHFAQVSVRDALHRFYRLAQQGLDIPFVWQNVREAVSDLGARYLSERQAEMADRQAQMANDIADNIGAIAAVQKFLHLIEYLLAAAYVAHLWQMFRGEGDKFNLSILFAAVTGIVMVEVLNRFLGWRHHQG